MFTLKPLPTFTEWLNNIDDPVAKGNIVARIQRLAHGLTGDAEPVGDGISELRVHIGAGWRVYYTQRGKEIIILLAGGTKRTQKADIKRAKALLALLD